MIEGNDILSGLANEIFLAVSLPIIAYLALKARAIVKATIDRFDAQLDEESRQRLEAAFENAIALAENTASGVNLQRVISYVERFNPGDLRRLRLGGSKLEERTQAAIAKAASSK